MSAKVKLLSITPNAKELIFAAARQCYTGGWIGDAWQEVEDGKVQIVDLNDQHICTDNEISNLVKYLKESGHTSVLEHVKFTFAIDDISRALSHQLVRHRIASYCVSEDTLIHTSSQKTDRKSIKELFNLTNQYKQNIKVRCVNEETNELICSKFEEIIYTGKQLVYEVITEHGYKICTTKNHKFFTELGWRALAEISIDDYVFINGIDIYKDKEWLRIQYVEKGLSQEDIGEYCGVSKHTIRSWVRKHSLQKPMGSWSKGVSPPNKGKNKFNYLPLSVVSKKMEGNKNSNGVCGEDHHSWKGSDITDSAGYGRIRRSEKKSGVCSLCKAVGYIEIHHKDGNPKNSNKSNLQEVCIICHKILHKKETRQKIVLSKVVSIRQMGEKETYDIHMPHPNHSYIANGFVVHNSQQSQRYVNLKSEFSMDNYVIPPKIKKNKVASIKYRNILSDIQKSYNELIELGIEPEDARFVLPNAAKTRIVMTMNCVALLHFFDLRSCSLAQWEIRNLSDKMLEICKEKLPVIFKNAGSRCISLGYCPESSKRSCGKYPIKSKIILDK